MKRVLAGLGAALGAALLWSTVVTVAPDEVAVVTRFGAATRELLPGLHLKAPWPLERTLTAPSPQVSRQVEIGFSSADRALGLGPVPRATRWLTGDSNIVELEAVIRYRVVDARAWLLGVSRLTALEDADPATGRDAVLGRLGEAALAMVCSETGVDEVLTGGRVLVGDRARSEVQARAQALGLGVEITDVQVLRSEPLASVAPAFRAVQEAVAERDTLLQAAGAARIRDVRDAEATAARLTSEAWSRSSGRITEAKARGKAFSALAAEVGPADGPAARRLVRERLREILMGLGELRVVQPGTPERPTVVYSGD